MAPKAPPLVLPEAWDTWWRTVRYPPEVIYHYTSADALLPILQTKRMWATNLLHTNDPTELIHGERIVTAGLDEAIAVCSNAFTCEWLDGFKHTTRRNLERNDRYSISFCTNGDLLSQWRGYGASGGGFAMGWKVLSDLPELPMRIGMTYDEQMQRDVVKDLIETHVAYVADIDSSLNATELERLKLATGSLGIYFSFCIGYFKHPAFAEEDEFRLVIEALDHKLPEGMELSFRRFGAIVKPYVEVDFSHAELVEVIYGPTTDPLTPKWLRSALNRFGFPGTVVKPSSVPMRA